MSGAATAVLVGSAIAAGATIYSSNQQAKSQKKATAQAQANAEQQATAAEQAMNAQNQKRPNTSEILDAATQAGRGGVSGTMLTGSQGVDKNAMALGRNALLGS
ncbi:MAG: hypothetical protein ACYCW7_13820 [Pseudomonadaceae bacterium]